MATKQTQVATSDFKNEVINPFSTIAGFEAAQRMGAMFSSSQMVPKAYQGNIGSCVIALDIAIRLNAAPLMVMQNLFIVNGNPSWASKFLIACFNTSGKYVPISYETNVGKEPDKNKWYCIAKSTILATGEEVESDKITWAMVDGEGWNKKPGSKWNTMPGQMFRYRAAAFLIRTTAPEISFGFRTEYEIEDGVVINTNPIEAVDINFETKTPLVEQIEQPTATEKATTAEKVAEDLNQAKDSLFGGVKL